MQVFVRAQSTTTLDVAACDAVEAVKARIEAAQGLCGVRLVFAGRQLEDGRTLSEYGVQKESTLHVLLGLAGGAKKRKKKTYTKPKKNKHKRRKVKLAFLQFYKVDDGGKVTRLRKECPSPECGPGTFMANHWDRHYCGKCGLTYVYSKEEMAKRGPQKQKVVAKVEVVVAAPAGKKKGKK